MRSERIRSDYQMIESGSRRDGDDRHRIAARLHAYMDLATGTLIFGIFLFTPWAFGTTERWAIRSVNTWNYILGGLLAAKIVLRAATGFAPNRWTSTGRVARWTIVGLAFATAFTLLYCAVAAINARADYILATRSFEYFESFVPWLPHSYAKSRSLDALRLYAACACFFWALRDWLLTKGRDDRDRDAETGDEALGRNLAFGGRLRLLLWIVSINAGILSVQGTLQRLGGGYELLWMVRPRFNVTAIAQFGPFNYRSNAAQYLNLIWPLALGAWWAISRSGRKKFGEGSELLFLVMAGLSLAAVFITSSRGGIAVALGQAIAVVFLFAQGRNSGKKATVALAIFSVTMAIGAGLQWQTLKKRLNENSFNTMSGRTEIYENARKIANDFRAWGAGPGSFGAIYQMYRETPDQIWVAHAHNDYLQTRVTFGRVGLAVILFAVFCVIAEAFRGDGIAAGRGFAEFALVGFGGALVHAAFDFPFQIYSILLLFLAIAAILTVSSRMGKIVRV